MPASPRAATSCCRASRLFAPHLSASGTRRTGRSLTLDLAGQARFGPDVEWLTEPDYHVSDAKIHAFEASIRRYWPGLGDGRLVAGYAGVRPKISGPNEAAADFRIDGPEAHGIPGWINLFGIESPGLTASLAIAEEVATRLAP